MSSYPRSPRKANGGLVLLSAEGAVRRIIALQYNPDSLSRTLQVQGAGEGGDHSEVFRLKGPAIETLKIDAEIDATDQLEFPDRNAATVRYGIQPQLAALEVLVNPASADLVSGNELAGLGTIEIAAAQAPLTLFVWGQQRIVAVRITEFAITEEAFDPDLNPIRAKVSLGMRVLSVNDVGFTHKAGTLFLGYLRNKERLAAQAPGAALGSLGLGGPP